jgi:CRISPR/Cas system CSM-associated protein Csm3 (group 7 of RAMP superfamily)
MSNEAHWQISRNVVERIIIKADLQLETPASLRNGESSELTDMPLLLDPLEGRALLTGASLAGALRSYLREREMGYGGSGDKSALYGLLFGGLRADHSGEQSPLITYDALSQGREVGAELRDGVKLDPHTRTAEDKKKFDLELLEAGAIFPLQVELLVIKNQEEQLKQGLALALQGFERGEIPIGGRKRRGLGQCRVKEWRVYRYDMSQPAGLIGWLDQAGQPEVGPYIADLLKVPAEKLMDKRRSFNIIEATFALDTSLLIRSGSGEANAPDMVHLHSQRNGKDKPILSGTSLAGALRARARRIAKTLGKNPALVDDMFGPIIIEGQTSPQASRVIVNECEIDQGITDLVQSRVKIDRFTGGSYPGALFNQQPVFSRTDGKTTLTINLTLRAPAKDQQTFEAEIGLLLLVLKDLWTGDLPLGGEISVGRGRLRGVSAKLNYAGLSWQLNQTDLGLKIEGNNPSILEEFVQKLQEAVL